MPRPRTLILLLLLAGVIWFAFKTMFGYRDVEVMGALAFGWLRFPARTLPKVSINWSGVFMVVVCSTIIWWLLLRITRSRRRTTGIFGAVWLLFVICIAASGLFAHTHALFTAGDSFLVRAKD